MINKEVFSTLYKTGLGTGPATINDLRQKELSGTTLSFNQIMAVRNFDRYKTSLLNTIPDPQELEKHYKQLQVMAKTMSYEEFLKDKFFA